MNDPRVVLLGSGGHAKVVLEIARALGLTIAGYCGPAATPPGLLLGTAWLGDDDALGRLREQGLRHFVAALGDNRTRERVTARAEAAGLVAATLIHPTAVVSPSARIGAGSVLMAGAVVNADTSIGPGSIVNTAASVDHDNEIGAFVHIAPRSVLAGCVSVGHGALVGVGSAVGRGRPLRIGAWARVGTGAVVIRDVPDGATVVGNPARRLSSNRTSPDGTSSDGTPDGAPR